MAEMTRTKAASEEDEDTSWMYEPDQPRPGEVAGAFAPFFTERARYKVAHGGRGSAKSHSFAQLAVTTGFLQPVRGLFAREIQNSLGASVRQLLIDKIFASGYQDHYRVTKEGIFGANGTMFLFAGLRTNPDKIKSMEGLDFVWVEEADRTSQASLDLLTPTLRKPGSEIWLSFNRNKVSDPVDDMFLGGTPPPDSIILNVSWEDNRWFPKELRREMEWMKQRNYDKYLHVWEGHPLQNTEAQVFTNWEVADIDGDVPERVMPLYGADWGFAKDPTVLIRGYYWDRTLYITHEAYKVRCRIDDTPKLFDTVPGSRQGRIIGDSARPETIDYMNRHGFTISRSRKGAGSVQEGVEFIQSCDVVIHPRCKHTIDEFRTYQYKVDKRTDEVLPELEDKNNHVIDSVRYALEAVRRSGLHLAKTEGVIQPNRLPDQELEVMQAVQRRERTTGDGEGEIRPMGMFAVGQRRF